MSSFFFWLLIFIILYSYVGYTLLLIVIKFLKKLFKVKNDFYSKGFEPQVSIVIAAYNEKDHIDAKIANLRLLDYPKEKLEFIWITDGSNDGSPELIAQHADMRVLHEDARNGKVGALNRGIHYIKNPIVIFCDANNLLSSQSVRSVVRLFADPRVGCVAGEKQIIKKDKDKAAGAGEGFYWNYESSIKKLESEIGSTVGAVGELFAIRRELYEPVEPDTLLDDFIISLRIAEKGYKIKYAPQAIATEASSASIEDELKRKIRIAAGSIQSIPRLKRLLNPIQYGFFSIQYWSHKVLRWTLVPLAMLLLLPLNIYLALSSEQDIYTVLLCLQFLFYGFSFIGYLIRKKNIPQRFIFIPYYLLIMNLALFLGFFRFTKGKQSVNWEKAKRQTH